MNFLRNRSLKHLGLILLGGLFLVFAVEFIIISDKIAVLEETENKKDYARSAQLESQQIAYLVELHLNGNRDLAPTLLAKINEMDHRLTVLGRGGRIDGSDLFLEPLSRLPAITYNSLLTRWNIYRENVMVNVLKSDIPVTDSTTLSLSALNGTALLQGQWLTLSDWYEKLLVDLAEEADARRESAETFFLVFAFADLFLIASLYFVFRRYVLKPLATIEANIGAKKQDYSFHENEAGAVMRRVNEILGQLTQATEFVAAIGEGKLDTDYRTYDSSYQPGANRLADELISMQEKLRKVNEEEQKRQWANEGLAKFVDILRSSDDNITTLGDHIISALVKYTNANQGGLYILNDEDAHDRHLELVSLFAFDNKKFEKQKVRLGEGILGQTFLEKETTLLNEVPEEYVRITSGLGGANPKSLLMVPLKVDREVYGIVELASFRIFQPHEIAFVEKLAETIASTLASVKVAQRNRNLIEQFQQQTEEMNAQEEEMRQNMEELQATQEELSRKEQDYIVRIRELEKNARENHDVARLKAEMDEAVRHYEKRVAELEALLAQKPPRQDDWAVAEEVEKTLRVQLEALRITAGKG